MYKLKQIPSDFLVEEINDDLRLVDSGKFSLYKLWKEDIGMFEAINVIARKLKTNLKFINYAGTKDKKAFTIQYITISNGPEKNYDLGNIRLEYIGKRKERFSLGELDGNRFTIIIRNIESEPKRIKSVPNYFDSQRFGANKNNHIIGKFIVKGEFDKALFEIEKFENVDEKYKKNPVKYFSDMSKKNSRMYVHAYQSHLFNKILETIIENGIKEKENLKLPLIGFGTEIEEFEYKDIIYDVMDKEGICVRDFIIRKIPYLSSEGDIRDAFFSVNDLTIGVLDEDDMNQGKKKCTVSFNLFKGSYATMVIRYMMN